MAKVNEIAQSNQYHLYYLPYLRLKEEIRIGEFILWPFYKQHEKRIEDEYVLAEIKALLDKYVDMRGKPLEAVTIIEREGAQLSKMEAKTLNRMGLALDILAFGVLYSKSVQKAVVSELFDIHEYAFSAGDTEATTLNCGSLEPISWLGKPRNMYQPCYLESIHPVEYDRDMVKGLENEYTTSSKITPLLASLRIFKEAFRNATGFPMHLRVILLATGFEVVFNISDRKSSRASMIAKSIDDSLGQHGKWSKRCRKTKEYTHSDVGWIGHDFYKVRNDCVHGSNMPSEQSLHTWHNAAVRLFQSSVAQSLADKGLYNWHPMVRDMILDEVLNLASGARVTK